MKQFFKFLLASILGFLIASFIFLMIFIGIVAALSGSMNSKPESIKSNSVLHLKFDELIPERSSEDPFASFRSGSFKMTKTLGVYDIIKNIQKAEKDSLIKGVFLDLTFIPSGIVTIQEIRQALDKFKSTGKFIVCYSTMMSQSAYYLTSVADEIYIIPQGFVEFRGLYSQRFFVKSALDKLGIDVFVAKGDENVYKSAPELFTAKEMSATSREQTKSFVQSMWNNMLVEISVSRDISIPTLNLLADTFMLKSDSFYINSGMITDYKYRDEVINVIKTKCGLTPDDKITLVSINRYETAPDPTRKTQLAKDKIAVIYANGDMVTGQPNGSDVMDGESISSLLRQVRKDSAIKAVVLRINSGGGSALAAEIIWREAKLTAEEKPLVVSFSNVAASGGYYIAAPAHVIVASPLTVTGSIGAFGLLPNMQKLFNDKLGITFDGVGTNKNANVFSTFKPVSDYEKKVLNEYVNQTYKTFIDRVGEGRHLSADAVHKVAKGRVWSGAEALEIGLIDTVGGLNTAISIACQMSGINDFRVVEMPEEKGFMEQLKNKFSEKTSLQNRLSFLGINEQEFNVVLYWLQTGGVLTRMPADYYFY
jgi:protease IV